MFRLLKTPGSFLAYRSFIAVYFLAWMVAQTSQEKLPRHFIYLTTWGEMLLNIYFLSTLGLTLYYARAQKEIYPKNSRVLRWSQRLTNGVRIMAFDISLTLTLAYWTMIRSSYDAFSWHCHLVNSISVLIDLIVSDHPGSNSYTVQAIPQLTTKCTSMIFEEGKADTFLVSYGINKFYHFKTVLKDL